MLFYSASCLDLGLCAPYPSMFVLKFPLKSMSLGLKSHLTLWLGKGEQNRTARMTLGLWEQLRSKLHPVEVTNGKGFTLILPPPILFVLFVTVFNAFVRILNFCVLGFESPLSVILDKCVDNLNFLSQSMLQPLFRKRMCVWWSHLGWGLQPFWLMTEAHLGINNNQGTCLHVVWWPHQNGSMPQEFIAILSTVTTWCPSI